MSGREQFFEDLGRSELKIATDLGQRAKATACAFILEHPDILGCSLKMRIYPQEGYADLRIEETLDAITTSFRKPRTYSTHIFMYCCN